MLARRKPTRSGIRDDDGPIRSPGHLKFVRGFVCACMDAGCSGRIEAHHIRTAATAGVGIKPGDEWAVPLCDLHHREIHSMGQDTFAEKRKVDLPSVAEKLARASAHIRKIKMERGI